MFDAPERSWTGRELARAAGVSSAQAARDLKELADTSLVSREVVGRSYSWRLRSAHILHTPLSELFRRERECRTALLRTISDGLRHAKVERARVYGSVSRGEERDDSDVDLFLQVATAKDRTGAEAAADSIRTTIWKRFGNPLSVLVYTRAEAVHPRNPELLRAIDREGLDVSEGG